MTDTGEVLIAMFSSRERADEALRRATAANLGLKTLTLIEGPLRPSDRDSINGNGGTSGPRWIVPRAAIVAVVILLVVAASVAVPAFGFGGWWGHLAVMLAATGVAVILVRDADPAVPALHRFGIPGRARRSYHAALVAGRHLVVAHGDPATTRRARIVFHDCGPMRLDSHPAVRTAANVERN